MVQDKKTGKKCRVDIKPGIKLEDILEKELDDD